MIRIEDWDNIQLAAQCVFPRLDTDKYFEDAEYKRFVVELIKLGVGGFCIFKGNTETVRRMTGELQSVTDIPLLFSADFENGVTMRLEDGTDFPHAMALGKLENPESVNEVAKAIAKETKDLNVYWNLAPVCDINEDPKNPVINVRSFGETAENVSKAVVEYIKGHRSEKIMTCAKHFPGHGNTSVDSHLAIPIISSDLESLKANELIPFVSAINNGVNSIMLGHLLIEKIDSEYPASLSKAVITGLLKDDLGFNGLIVTDALDMKAISDKYSSGEASYLCLSAGAHIALLPADPIEAINYLTEKLASESDFKTNIIAAVKKIYNEKRKCGLIPMFASNEPHKIFNTHQKIALKAAYEAVRLEGKLDLLPIDENQRISAFAFLQRDEDLRSAARFYTLFFQALESDCDLAYIDLSIDDEQLDSFVESTEDSELVILSFYYKGRAFQGEPINYEKLSYIAQKLSAGKKCIAIFFGNPYIDRYLDADVKVFTYSDSFASIAACVMKMAGRELFDY